MLGKNYIGGRWSPATTEDTFESRNPTRKDEVVGSFPRSNEEDVDRAVVVAREALPAWRRLSRIRRGEYLDEFAQSVKNEVSR